MAIQRYGIDGYGVLELNQVAFPTTGTVEAQCKLDYTNDFKELSTENSAKTICEVGMLLAVDKANDVVKLPTVDGTDVDGSTTDDEILPIGINYTSEFEYNQYVKGLNKFAMTKDLSVGGIDLYGVVHGDLLPRIGFLTVGDKFTSNCLAYDPDEFDGTYGGQALTDDAALEAALDASATTPVYGTYGTNGAILLTKTAPKAKIVLKVVKGKDWKLPDGIHRGVMLQVIKA